MWEKWGFLSMLFCRQLHGKGEQDVGFSLPCYSAANCTARENDMWEMWGFLSMLFCSQLHGKGEQDVRGMASWPCYSAANFTVKENQMLEKRWLFDDVILQPISRV
jgi:hypothetical protein